MEKVTEVLPLVVNDATGAPIDCEVDPVASDAPVVHAATQVMDVDNSSGEIVSGSRDDRALKSLALLIALGWLGTNLGLNIGEFTLKFLLKDTLNLTAAALSGFFVIGQFTNYIKPVAGILTDSFPLFGTRRRSYLMLSLLGTGLLWLLLCVVPRSYTPMLVTYTILYATVMITSTSLGGFMVEIGNRYQAAGRLTSQRIAMFRIGTMAGQPLGGKLAGFPFFIAAGITAVLHLILVPLYFVKLEEAPTKKVNKQAWNDAGDQLKSLVKNRVLMGAAVMICLIAASPGFNTPLLFFQTNTLHFSKLFVGWLGSVGAGGGILATVFYFAMCRKVSVRTLLVASIIVHALGTLFYLGYHTHTTALIITGLSGITGTLAMLPVYDLAARGTPSGSEALGYSVMMSVWNLTNALSDWSGSSLFTYLHFTFTHLIFLNAGTTILVLFAIPFMPRALMMRKDGPG